MLHRGISASEAKAAIMLGEIIEDYPEDYPFPSCLVMGVAGAGRRCLHVVCAAGENKLWIVTAYEPSLQGWKPGFRERKGEA
jgi:hypothetical protein